MGHRIFRSVAGGILILILTLQVFILIYPLVILLLFESLSNWLILKFFMRLKYGNEYLRFCGSIGEKINSPLRKISFDAERLIFIILSLFLVVTIIFQDIGIIEETSYSAILINFIPWIFGFALLISGFTNFCPFLIFLRWIGYK